MTLLWNEPRVWDTADAITKERLNAISNSLSYLYSPSRKMATVRGTGSNLTTTLSTFSDIDNGNYQLNVELLGTRPVTIELVGVVSNATLAAVNKLDVVFDGSTYVSSLTTTPLNNGLWAVSQPVANYLIPVVLKAVIPAGVLSAGFHLFQPRFACSAGTLTWYGASGVFSQFSVGEYQ